MVNFYINKIKNSSGAFTVNDVPSLWRSRVEKRIEEMTAENKWEYESNKPVLDSAEGDDKKW